MGEVVQLFGDAAEPNSTQAFTNCYEDAKDMAKDLAERHALDYDGAVIAIIAALLDEAELAAPKHQSAQAVLDWLEGRDSVPE